MDTPHPPGAHHLKPGNIAAQLKNPKTLALLAALAIGFALYVRNRNASPAAAPSGSSTPVTDPNADLQATQGAAQGSTGTDLTGGVDTSGSFGGFDSAPDWYTTPPSWYTDSPDQAAGTPGSAAGVTEGPVSIHAGDSIYDPHTGKLLTAPASAKTNPKGKKPPKSNHPTPKPKPGTHHATGGGPPTTHANAHKPPPKHTPHPASKPGKPKVPVSVVGSDSTHIYPTSQPTHPATANHSTPAKPAPPVRQTPHAPAPPPKPKKKGK